MAEKSKNHPGGVMNFFKRRWQEIMDLPSNQKIVLGLVAQILGIGMVVMADRLADSLVAMLR